MSNERNNRPYVKDFSNTNLFVNNWKNKEDNITNVNGISVFDTAPVKDITVLRAGVTLDGVFDQIKNTSGADGVKYSLRGTYVIAFDGTIENYVFNDSNLFTFNSYITTLSKPDDVYIIQKLTVANLEDEQAKIVQQIFSVDTPLTDLAILIPLSSIQNIDITKIHFDNYPMDIVKINSVDMLFDSNTKLIGKIFGKGSTNKESQQDIDWKITAKGFVLGVIQALPISTQQKVTMYSRWLDIDITFPFKELQKLFGASGKSIKQFFDIRDTSEKALYKTIVAMLIATKEGGKGFPSFPRNDKIGKPIETAKIFDLLLQSKEGETLSQIGADLVQQFKDDFPNEEYLPIFKTFQEFINMLSNYIRSEKYATAKGGSRLNEIALPWALQLRKSVTTNTDNVGVVTEDSLLQDIIVSPVSQYYKFDDQGKIIGIKDGLENISFYQTIKADSKVALAEIPEKLQAENTSSNPADIDPRKEDTTKYIWYTPTDNYDNIESLFTDLSSATIKKGTVDANARSFKTQKIIIFDGSGWSASGGFEGFSIKVGNEFLIPQQYANQDYSYTSNSGQSTDVLKVMPNIIKAVEEELKNVENIIDNYLVIPNGFKIHESSGAKDISYQIINKKSNINFPRDGITRFYYEFQVQGTYKLESTKDVTVPKITNDSATFDKPIWKEIISRFMTVPYELKLELADRFRDDGKYITKINSIPMYSIWGGKVTFTINYTNVAGVDKEFVIGPFDSFNLAEESSVFNEYHLNIKTNSKIVVKVV